MKKSFARYLAILQCLPQYPKRIGTEEILQRLSSLDHEVTLRTIQRDLNTLSESFPIHNDDAKPGGWSWQQDAALTMLPGLDPHAALVLQLALSHLKKLMPDATLDHLKPHFRQAEEILDELGNGLRKWPDKIRVVPRGPMQAKPVIQPEVQAALYEALLKDKKARIRYRKNDNLEIGEYEISPLGLVVRDRMTYLVCTYDGYSDPRHIALHRVEAAEVLDTSAVCPRGFSLDAFIQQGELSISAGRMIKLCFALTEGAARQLIECPLSPDQTVEASEAEGFLIIRATVQDSMELRWWLQSFGDEAEILEPEALREEFREMATNLSSYYDETDA